MEDSVGRRHAGPDSNAAAIELAALGSAVIAYFVAVRLEAVAPGTAADAFAIMAVGVGSGFGWLRARRPVHAALVSVAREALTAPYVYFGLQSLGCEGRCSSSSIALGMVLFVAFVGGYFAIPIASAVLLVFGNFGDSRDRYKNC